MTETHLHRAAEQERAPLVSNVLVPLDGSDRSARALPVAAALAERLHATVSVVDCLPPEFSTDAEERWVAERVAVLDGQLVEPRVHVTDEVVADLLATAAATPGTVVCLASHGRSGIAEVLLGSVTRELILESPTPVVVVGPASRAPESFDTLQVCFDGSSDSEATLQAAVAWAHGLAAMPWLTHVVDEIDLTDVSPPGDVAIDGILLRAAARLRATGLDPAWDVLHGRNRVDALVSWAAAQGSDLLVVGGHARPVIDRMLGTVTTRLLHVAPCPVLVVGPNAVAH